MVDAQGGGLALTLARQLSPDGATSLHVGGVLACELVERHGSPLYAYDAGALRGSLADVRHALGPRVEVLFAVKANPAIGVGAVLFAEGAGADVASAGEIDAALAAGCPAARMHFAGPGKTRAEIEHAIRVGVGCLSLESAAEYAAVAECARAAGVRPRVAIRVNPPPEVVRRVRMAMGGAGKKFGVDASDVEELVQRVVGEDAVELAGLHTYAGTQCFSAEAWLGTVESLLDLAEQLESSSGARFDTLNFGGGFGVGYYEGDPEFDLAAAGEGLARVLDRHDRPGRRYIVELGRRLVATAGVFLASVTYVKTSGGVEHAILDGGMNQHAAAAGVGSIMRRAFPMVRCTDFAAEVSGGCSVGGPLCTPADEFAAGAHLPPLVQGDVVAFLASGAYGLTFSAVGFLSHPLPAEVLVDDGRVHVIRERGTREDLLRGQRTST